MPDLSNIPIALLFFGGFLMGTLVGFIFGFSAGKKRQNL
jgi:hypothetical protein